MTPAHSTRKHSDYAASASHRWMNCLGSVALCKKAPPQEESFHAKEGTDAHECLEFIVRRFGSLEKAKADALKKWPEEMVSYAEISAREIFALKPSPTAKLLIETRVHLKQIAPNFFGTLDYAWVDTWGRLVVIDYKYGKGVSVFPKDENGEENSQLMYYAAGLAYKYSYEFDEVQLVIIQPRVWSEDGADQDRQCITTIGKLRAFENKLKVALKASKLPNAPLKEGDWCRWCPAAPLCPQISENQLRKADIFFDVQTSEIQAVPEPSLLNIAHLPKILDACDVLETWIDKVRDRAFELAQRGEKIQGRKLVQKRAIRSWLPGADQAAKKKFGDEVFETTLLSPAQFEKKLGKAAKKFASEHTTSISSGVTLVPESDKRPEVKDVNYFK